MKRGRDGEDMKNTTFIIEIKSNQYNSWQGSIEWIEGKRMESFRSVLELVKLMDSAIEEQGENGKSKAV